MLDDLLLLEQGRTVFAGSIQDAAHYFKSVGYANNEAINPSDYYLDLAQKPPNQSTKESPITWLELFQSSPYYTKFQAELAKNINARVQKPMAAQPTSLARFKYLFQYFMYYFSRERGFYVNRLYALILLGIFIGTLYLDLETKTSKIGK